METTKIPSKRERAFLIFESKKDSKKEIFLNHTFFTYIDNVKNSPCLAVFNSRGHRTIEHFIFPSNEARSEHLTKLRKRIQNSFDAEQNHLSKYKEEAEQFQKGKILISSWGCEQTNIDFYLIVDRKNDFVTIQEIESKREYSKEGDRGTTTPDISKTKGEPFKKKISKYASLQLESYKYCRLWDGKPEYFSSYA